MTNDEFERAQELKQRIASLSGLIDDMNLYGVAHRAIAYTTEGVRQQVKELILSDLHAQLESASQEFKGI